MPTYEELLEENADLKRRIGIGEDDPAKEGYLVLVDLLRNQNKYLKGINQRFTSLITATEEKGKASEYERAKALWTGLGSMIETVNGLKITLKMEGEKKKDTYKPISAKEIANGNV